LLVTVPAIISKSLWRGVARNITPNLSKSYLLTVACIISTAQHANPKVKGHNDPCLAHEIKEEAGVVKNSTRNVLVN